MAIYPCNVDGDWRDVDLVLSTAIGAGHAWERHTWRCWPAWWSAAGCCPGCGEGRGMAFDPNDHLRTLKGQRYLDVKYRLVWLRDDCPEAIVTTELRHHEIGQYALFVASVARPGRGSATGWGSETAADFGDYLEKAETKALGRALAALGYGTAQAAELDEGDAVADSPVAPYGRGPVVGGADQRRPAPPRPATAEELSGKPPAAAGKSRRQELNSRLLAAMADRNVGERALLEMIRAVYDAPRTAALADDDLEAVIDWVEDRREVRQASDGSRYLAVVEAAR